MMKLNNLIKFGVVLFVILFSLNLSATVSQVDGTIVPIERSDDCPVWNATNYGEGFFSDITEDCNKTCTGGPDCIDAQADADTNPQIFMPTYGGTYVVTFTDLMEQAGYENTFGWYNVGDPSNRYPIFICSDEPIYETTVDFQVELDEGRYYGGYIGFYIITPQSSPSGENCGSDEFDSSGNSEFGHIYFTESVLNGDGDYVHSLVYSSKVEPTRFYFAFEDLFRGGDNDFSDYVIKVEGIVPSCIPSPEICDGKDNDCDGIIDEDTVDAGGNCGIDTGECQFGTLVCTDGTLVCSGEVGPSVEICDGLDNDCNGNVDDNLIDVGTTCGTDVGECQFGSIVCAGGTLICSGGVQPESEVCDNLDNDCNGIVDDSPIDTGGLCGSNVGICRFGTIICSTGTLICDGAISPSAEVCDGTDNDCDGFIDNNPVDIGQPCGITEGLCQSGLTVCQAGTLECNDAIGPTNEICDGLDNNCNGQIDEDNPGGGGICGPQEQGQCHPGIWLCLGGSLVCDGAVFGGIEVCDGEDNDCDGEIDNGAICPGGGQCVDGECLLPCNSEFCPSGMDCVDNLCIPNACYGVDCETSENCVDGNCINRCDLFECDEGFECDRDRGICIEDNCYGKGCPDGQICVNAVCTTDLCLDKTCNDNEFCRNGECIKSCVGVRCEEGKQCIDGSCVDDLCYDVNCKSDEICKDGTCIDNLCIGIICGNERICGNGICVDDPCNNITCNSGVCSDGQCEDKNPLKPLPPAEKITSGGGCSSSGSQNNSFLGFLFVLFIFFTVSKFKKQFLLLISFIFLFSVSCNNSIYVIHHDVDDTDYTSDATDDVQNNNSDCYPIPGGGEICDGKDNNCDGLIDETFDLNTDPKNCGQCGNECDFPGAYATCVDGECIMGNCAAGYVDLNQDSSDGCEYRCYSTNDGVEICDGLDNDCNGIIDDADTLSSDINNCGGCGKICAYNNAEALCQNGQCVMSSCNDGFLNINSSDIDGCEYQCTPTNGGVETCDGTDNDCDGIIDNPSSPPSDDNNCGACGRVCVFNNRYGTCDATTLNCIPGDCFDNYYNINGLDLDGCEYYCEITNGGVEVCDGLDNNCDGNIDEGNPEGGASCGTTDEGECQRGTKYCIGGSLVCVGNIEPVTEICDGLDNDCDGNIDEGNPEGGAACGTTDEGECQLGTLQCTNGALLCVGAIEPTDEICDYLDNDCDGNVDLPGCLYASGSDVRVDTATDEGEYNSINVYAATDGSYVYTTWSDARSSSDIYFSVSSDAGNTFDTEVALENSSDNAMHPKILVDNSSSTHYLYVYWERFISNQRDFYVAISTNYGQSFGSVVQITNSSLDSIRAKMISDNNGVLYIVREDYREQSGTNTPYRNIFLNVSSDHGSTWSSDIRVNQDLTTETSFTLNPSLILGQNNRLFVVWQDYRNGKPDIYLNYTDDFGVTWQSSDIQINTSIAGSTTCDNPLIIADNNGNVYVFYEDFRDGETSSVYMNVSHNNGETWLTSDVLLSSGTANAFDIDAVIDGNDNLHIVWQDYREGLPQIRYIKSEDYGVSIKYDSPVDPRIGFSLTPKIRVTPAGNPIVAYLDKRNGFRDVFVNFSIDGGETFQASDLRLDTGSSPGSGDSIGLNLILTGNSENIPCAAWFDSRFNGIQSDIYVKSLDIF